VGQLVALDTPDVARRMLLAVPWPGGPVAASSRSAGEGRTWRSG
jgi:hypothetical protein